MPSSISPGLDTFSRLLEENCSGLDAESVFLLTQRVRAELAVIQHEVEESRLKLKKALLRERLHRRQQVLMACHPMTETIHVEEPITAPLSSSSDQRSILENIGTLGLFIPINIVVERTINVAEDKVRLYLQKIRQIEARHDIHVVSREAFIRLFTQVNAALDPQSAISPLGNSNIAHQHQCRTGSGGGGGVCCAEVLNNSSANAFYSPAHAWRDLQSLIQEYTMSGAPYPACTPTPTSTATNTSTVNSKQQRSKAK